MQEPDSWNDHIAEEMLEAYALSRLGEREVEDVEAHLLVCEPCRERLVATEAFAAAMRAAAPPKVRCAGRNKEE